MVTQQRDHATRLARHCRLVTQRRVTMPPPQRAPYSFYRSRMTFAGTPPATTIGGRSLVTTAPAPTTVPRPTRTPGSSVAR